MKRVSMLEELEELHRAWEDLRCEVIRALRIEEIVIWLAKLLGGSRT